MIGAVDKLLQNTLTKQLICSKCLPRIVSDLNYSQDESLLNLESKCMLSLHPTVLLFMHVVRPVLVPVRSSSLRLLKSRTACSADRKCSVPGKVPVWRSSTPTQLSPISIASTFSTQHVVRRD